MHYLLINDFSSEQCPEGVVSVAEDSLRIFSTEQLDNIFNQTIIPLRYTPKKVFINYFYFFLLFMLKY